MKKIWSLIPVVLLGSVILAACFPGGATTPPGTPPATLPVQPTSGAQIKTGAGILTVMTHDSFAISEQLKLEFEKQNKVQVNFLTSGDTGAALNRAILSKESPLADVFYGVDNTFLSRALSNDIFEPYASPLIKDIPEIFKLDPQNRVLPMDYGDVCINYDKIYFVENKLTLPEKLEDLTKPDYKGLLVVQNPATSSPGLAFLLTTIAHFGPTKYLDFWKELRKNEVTVVNSWETAYNTNFTAGPGGGSQPMVVSYASSPAAEIIFAKQPTDKVNTAALTGPDMCFRQIEFAGILKGTKQRALAEKFIDFMLNTAFQEEMPLQMFVYPVNPKAKLPEAFAKYTTIPEKPAKITADEIAKGREQWITEWDKAVLK